MRAVHAPEHQAFDRSHLHELLRSGERFAAWSLLHETFRSHVRRLVARERLLRKHVDATCERIWIDVYQQLRGARADLDPWPWLHALVVTRFPSITSASAAPRRVRRTSGA